MLEKSEIKEYKGYRYITVRMPVGHVCGYVEIPKGHYLYKKGYEDPILELEPFKEDIFRGSIGKRGILSLLAYALKCEEENQNLTAEIVFDIHGSLTFGDRLQFHNEPEAIFEWAMGFDTAHYDDTSETQTHEYCEKECQYLIDQLVEIDQKLKNYKEINIKL